MRQLGTGRIVLMSSTVLLSGYLMGDIQPAEAANKHFGPLPAGLRDQGMSRHDLRVLARNNRAIAETGRMRAQSVQINVDGGLVRLNSGVNLDLASQVRNITLGRNLFSSGEEVTIVAGGETRTLTAGSHVSAAEYIAAKQVLAGEGQKILVDHSGRASGGEVDLDAITADNDRMRAASLVVAANVTTYGDFGKRSDFRLLGDLDNFGTVHALSSDARVRTGAIRAQDINNHAGAVIRSDVGLTLDASGSLNNEGTISAVGSLSLSASDAINNHGTIQSKNGDINLNAPQALMVNNSRGTIMANNGAINVRAADYTGTHDSTVIGGDLVSRELNLNSGQGLAGVAVKQLSGVVNGTGNAAHVLCSTEVMKIGSICLTGDPTFFNSTGSIHITNPGITSGSENLVIAASGNITSDANVTIEAGNTLQGFGITMIAGAEITPVTGTDSKTLPGGTAGAISLSGKASKTGGSILLGANNKIMAQANPLGVGSQDAGDVNLWAFAGKQAGSGVIDVSDTSILAKGNAKGFNGIIQMTAGAQNTDAIKTGGIDITGGVVPGGLFLGTVQPTTSDKKQSINYSAAGVQSGASLVASTKKSKGANIVLTGGGGGVIDLGLSIPGAEPIIAAGGEIFINQAKIQADTTFGDLLFEAGADIRMAAGTPAIKAAAVSLFAGGSIGSASDHVHIDAGSASAGAEGSVVFVDVAGAGTTNFVALFAQDEIHISAPNRTFSTTGDMEAKNMLILDVFDFGGFGYGFVKEKVSLTATNAAGQPLLGSYFGTDDLILNIAAGVGTKINPVETGFNDNLTMTGAAVYAFNSASKAEVMKVTANTEAIISGPMILSDSNVSAGVLTAEVSKKTLIVDGKIFARDGINISNKGTAGSSKIVFAAGTTMDTLAAPGLGAINITVGNGTPAPNPGPFPFIDIATKGTGAVLINGSGVKGEAPNNTLNAFDTTLTINNNLKIGNILFEGGVVITADPPTLEDNPIITIEGPTTRQRQNRGTGFGAGQPASLGADPDTLVSSSAVSFDEFLDPSPAFRNGMPDRSVMNLITTNSAGVLTATSLSASASDDSYMISSSPRQSEHDALVCTDVDAREIGNGSTLFVPSGDLSFATEAGTVRIAAGSIVLVSMGRNHLSIYDLHDEARGAVTIEGRGKVIALAPGRHVCIASNHAHNFASVNPIEAIPHRGLSQQKLGNDRTVFQSEFSILSTARAVKPLKAIMSSDRKVTRRVAQKLMKTTAVLLTLSNNAVPYEFHVKPNVVALMK